MNKKTPQILKMIQRFWKYISDKLPKSLNHRPTSKLEVTVFKAVGTNIKVSYVANPNMINQIWDANNYWNVQFLLDTSEKPNKFELVQPIKHKQVKSPRFRNNTSLKKLADDLIKWFHTNEKGLLTLQDN